MQINRSLGGITFEIDADGNCGYRKPGADTVTPFRNAEEHTIGRSVMFANEGALSDSSYDLNGYKKIRVNYVNTNGGSALVRLHKSDGTYVTVTSFKAGTEIDCTEYERLWIRQVAQRIIGATENYNITLL